MDWQLAPVVDLAVLSTVAIAAEDPPAPDGSIVRAIDGLQAWYLGESLHGKLRNGNTVSPTGAVGRLLGTGTGKAETPRRRHHPNCSPRQARITSAASRPVSTVPEGGPT